MSETWKYLTLFTLFTLIVSTRSYYPCSNAYGAKPCSFLPAPPGKTPSCALPGLTYCEYPEHYPSRRIHNLIQEWRFEHNTLITDESKDEFTSYFYPPPSYNYGPSNTIKDSYYPEPIYIPKPNYASENPNIGHTYIPPNPFNQSHIFNGYPDSRPLGQFLNYKYTNNIPSGLTETYGAPPQSYFNPYVKVWDRKNEKMGKGYLRRRRRRDLKRLWDAHKPMTNDTSAFRRKRQSTLMGQTLCSARSQYVMPKAALNNKGNWMYVVNMPEADNRYTQLVKSETCLSQTCSGLCSLPVGYTSRCEQKFVQKRLVALEGSGDGLYTDVFWFPSCCVCTISNS